MNASQRQRRRERREAERLRKMRNDLEGCLDFERLTDPATLSASALACEVGVGWKRSVQSFMLARLKNCIQLSDELRRGAYRKKPANHFVLFERGHTRWISAVHFRDRVVQKAYCDQFLIPVLHRGLILDNSASQLGKGTDFARNRFALHLEQALRRYGPHAWVAFYDFKSYFASIDPERAMQMIASAAAPLVQTPFDRQNLDRMLELGRHFICEEDGLGLGNQTSQAVAIAYAGPIDHAIREVCGCGLSGRYMDDGYAFCRTKEDAYAVLAVAQEHARRLGLTLHPRKTGVAPAARRNTFLKTVFYPGADGAIRREVSRETVRRYKRHYKALVGLVARGRVPADVLDMSEGSWKGVALRSSDAERCQREMARFFEAVKQRSLPGYRPED